MASSLHLNDFCEFLLKEIDLQKNYVEGEKVETIYFGGGTPSLMPESFIEEVIEKIHQTFLVSENPEITLEANPDDVTNKKLKEWRLTSVNRISIGTQSFIDNDLKFLKRIHNSSQAEASVKRSQDAGFENISIDLIYGVPVQTETSWKENIAKAFSLQVPHVSAYALTVEEKTSLSKQIFSKKIQPIDEEESVSQYKILMNKMREHNFLHYEISNFCKDGFFSRHNTSYWKDAKYLGLGPSAHSYNHVSRQWNTSNLVEYLKCIAENRIPAEKEILSTEQKLNEYLMTSLRTMWGCDISFIERTFGAEEKQRILDLSKSQLDKGYIEIKNEIIFLTDEGKLFADAIAAELFC